MCSAPHNHTFTRYQWSVIITNNICFSLVRGNTFNGDSGYLFSSMYSTLWDDCAVQTQWKGTRKESCAPPWRSNPWKRLQRYRFSCYPWKKKREARKKKNLNVDDVFFFFFFLRIFLFRFFLQIQSERYEQDCLAEDFSAHVAVSNGKTSGINCWRRAIWWLSLHCKS